MRYYERFFPVAVLACVAAGVLCFARSETLSASQDFLAVALGIGLDHRLRRRWWLLDDDDGTAWERRRSPN